MAANPFECPITYSIMTDPVIDLDGNTYERQAIVQWLLTHDFSPLTRRPMRIEDLKPNRALKALIEAAAQVPVKATLKTSTSTLTIGKPVNLVLLADVSGSMNETCAVIEGAGFTRAQLLEHALMTVLHSMSDGDTVSLVSFNNRATVLTGLLPVTDVNRQILIDKVTSLQPGGGTNIWSALEKGLSLSKTCTNGEPVHILLFTDGVSYENPPSGIIPTLTGFLSGGEFNARIHTFGFGNDINSELLFDIAQLGNSGVFNYISGPEMVGTVFVNTLAYIKSDERPQFKQEDMSLQTRFIEILKTQPADSLIELELELEYFCRELDSMGTPLAKDMVLDCRDSPDESLGQIYKAFSPRFWKTWGQHYIRSVVSAYQNMFPLNFKDNGIKHFKTPLFTDLQQQIEKIFLTLDPPTPRSGHEISSAVFATTTYNPHGGCFLQGTLIEIPGKKFIDVSEVKPGHQVTSPVGVSTVKLVLKLKYSGPVFRYGTAALTEFHPVFFGPIDTENPLWFFPGSYQSVPEQVTDEYVYDFILDSGHVVNLKDLNAVTLCHNFTAPVVRHTYFGSNLIDQCLKKHQDYQSGYITLDKYKFRRDIATGLVTSLDF